FLFYNIYPTGFPVGEEDTERGKAQIAKLDAQLEALNNFKGKSYFTPGNHDWIDEGVLGVRAQEAYVEAHLNKGIEDEDDWENYYLPDRGCGGPELVEITDQLVVIFVDSNWYLRDWDKEHISLNQGCEALSREKFYFLLEELTRKHRNKNVIIASHHPIYTYGPHGGRYSLKNIIFPLTQLRNNLYVPLPVLGSLAAIFRSNIGSRQDVAHRVYKDYREDLLASTTKHGSYIFASGHEHNLQYIERKEQKIIVSGAGSKKSPVALGRGSKFAFGGNGFSKIDFYQDGSAWLSFIATQEDGTDSIVYVQKIKSKLEISPENIPEEFPILDKEITSIKTQPTLMQVKSKGKLHKAFLGAHYRDLYAHEYDFPVLDLADFEGGAYPVKRGGGNQTNSLRLKTKDGRQFAMRALTKDVSRLLPYPLNKSSVASSVVAENFLSTHPFTPLVIPGLADAVDIYHTNPKLFYVPKQPLLGVHNDLFGGDVYLIEERPSKGHEEVDSFGETVKFYSTPDVSEKLRKSHKHKIDQAWVIRSRLFDLLIGDWDRHDDQWRWQMRKVGKKKFYRPIPRDRDQVFSKYDGVVAWIAREFVPFMRQLKVYDYEIKHNTKWDNWSSRYFNQSFLNEITWEVWEKEAQFLKDNLTDEVINEAFKAMPQYAQEKTSESLKAKLRQRREDIVTYARQFYEFFSDEISIFGTKKDERFEITRRENGKTLVEIFYKDKKEYSRLFDYEITKEIHIYGLRGDDVFNIQGEADQSSTLRIIGGLGEDVINDRSKVKGWSKKTKYYDSKKGNTLNLGTEGSNKTSKHKRMNYFDRRDIHHEHDFDVKYPMMGFNRDDGFILGAVYDLTRYRFKKVPYSDKHKLSLSYAFRTEAISFDYESEYMQAVKDWDFTFDVNVHGPRNTFNYFGYGNNTPNTGRDNRRFNEVRISRANINLGLRRRFSNQAGSFKVFPLVEWLDVQQTENRLLTLDRAEQGAEVFDAKFYLGTGLSFKFANLSNFMNPKSGISFSADYKWRTLAETVRENFSSFNTDFTFFLPLMRSQQIVLASKVGYGLNFGGDYEFYYGQTIGGDNLRGFRNERFLGDRAFYHMNDLRIRVISNENTILPFVMGFHGGFDYGKVWLNDQPSEDDFNYSYGGGFWLEPAGLAVISFGYYKSKDDVRVAVKFGHQF
ncbi:MAG: BamA/TamA family outer membrane protein, partial [Saprospiraceae bacterium]